MQLTPRHIPWIFMTVLSLFLSVMTFMYLNFKSDVNFLLQKQDVVFDFGWRTAFYFHVIAGIITLSIGPFQFTNLVLKSKKKIHKYLGRIYGYTILVIGVPTGIYLAIYAEGGLPSTLAFLTMSLLWGFTTVMGIFYAISKKFDQHRAWMVRSFAMTFSAVTLRLLVPLLSISGMDPEMVIISTAWLSWITNLIIAEFIIRYKSYSFTIKTLPL